MKLRKINSIIESIEKYRRPETYGSEVYGNKVLEKSNFGSAVGHEMAVQDHYANLENANDSIKDKTKEDSKCIDKVNSQPKEVKSDELRKMKLSEEVGRWNSSDEYMSRWIEKEITKLLENEGISFESVHAKKNISHVEIKVLVDGGDKKKDHISLNRAVSDFLDENSFELDGVSEENVEGDKEGIYTAYHVFDAVDRRAYSSLRESNETIVDESMKKNNALELRKAFSKAFGEVKDGEPFAIIATNVENLRKDTKREANEEEYEKINKEAKKYLEENGKRAKGMWKTEPNPDTFIIQCDLDTAKSLSTKLYQEEFIIVTFNGDKVLAEVYRTEDVDYSSYKKKEESDSVVLGDTAENLAGHTIFNDTIFSFGLYGSGSEEPFTSLTEESSKNESLEDDDVATPKKFTNGKLADFDLEELIGVVKERHEPVNSIRDDDEGNIYFIIVHGAYDANVQTGNHMIVDVVKETPEGKQKRILSIMDLSSWDEIKKEFNDWKNSVVSPKNEEVIDERLEGAFKQIERALSSYRPLKLSRFFGNDAKWSAKNTQFGTIATFGTDDGSSIALDELDIDKESAKKELEDYLKSKLERHDVSVVSSSFVKSDKAPMGVDGGIVGIKFTIKTHLKNETDESICEDDEPVCDEDEPSCDMDDEPYFDDSTEDKSFDFEDDEPIYWGDR